MAAKKIPIIGIGDEGIEGLTAAARQRLLRADVVIGGARELSRLPDLKAKRIPGDDLGELAARIDAQPAEGNLVVVTSGDPLFYGVARYLGGQLGKDRFEVIPHVSSMQLAFARVMESWEEAFLTNLANHDLAQVVEQIRGAEKVGIFTTVDRTPAMVAESLLAAGIDYFTAYVCENLGSPDERVTCDELAAVARMPFDSMNVMILVRKPHMPDRPSEAVGRRLFGNPDEAFLQSRPKRGLLTPSEIRSIALAELDLGPASVVWDVGAGSGSVAIEAAQLAPQGRVFAIEQDVADCDLIRANAARFGVENLTPVAGHAPEAWAALPQPDAIFIGGSGRGISGLVAAAFERLPVGGRLVATMGSVDNLAETHQALRGLSGQVKVWMLHFARGNDQLERVRFESLNPTFLISVVK